MSLVKESLKTRTNITAFSAFNISESVKNYDKSRSFLICQHSRLMKTDKKEQCM